MSVTRETLIDAVVDALKAAGEGFGHSSVGHWQCATDEDTCGDHLQLEGCFGTTKLSDHLHSTVAAPLLARIAELEARLSSHETETYTVLIATEDSDHEFRGLELNRLTSTTPVGIVHPVTIHVGVFADSRRWKGGDR